MIHEVEVYRSDEDVLGQFIDERCTRGAGKSAIFNTFVDDLNSWLKGRGQHHWSAIKISKRLKDAGFGKRGEGKERHFILGLEIQPNPQQAAHAAANAKHDNDRPKIRR